MIIADFISPFVVLITVFAGGFMCGFLVKDNILEQQYQQQRERGDYWFDRYQDAIADEWWKCADEDDQPL